MNSELKNLLQQSSDEIKILRKQNEIMGAKLDMFDKIFLIFDANARRSNSICCSEDVAYKIDKYLENEKQGEINKVPCEINIGKPPYE